MKLGTVSDNVNTISLNVQKGFSAPETVQKDKKKLITFVDKSTEVINFGSRLKRVAHCTFVNLLKADYVTLCDYFGASLGSKIKIEEQNDGEKLFTESVISETATSYYCYLTAFEPQGENEFSQTRELFSVTVSFSFAGQNSTDEINAADTSELDYLIKINTARADDYQSTAPVSPATGDRWFDTDDNNLYEYNGTAWVLLYTVAADDSAYGFIDGTFYLSSFNDISQDGGAGIEQNYISNHLLKGSISPPKKGIEISKGPNIAFREGFSFNIANDQKFWNYVNTNKINLYGAEVTLAIFDNSQATKFVKIATGYINNNDFDYTGYMIQCEPRLLNHKEAFNENLVSESDSRYTGVQEKFLAKPVYATFGQHDLAVMQNVSLEEKYITVTKVSDLDEAVGTNTQTITAYIDWNVSTNDKILIRKTGAGKVKYTFTSAQITDIANGAHSIFVQYDTKSGSSNKDTAAKITNFEDEPAGYTGFYVITLSEGLTTAPDEDGATDDPPRTSDSLIIVMVKNQYRFQIDDEAAGGFKKVDSNGDFSDGFELWGFDKTNKNLESVPLTDFVLNADKNLLELEPHTSAAGSKVETYIALNQPGDGRYLDAELSPIDGNKVDFIGPLPDDLPNYFGTKYKSQLASGNLYDLQNASRFGWFAYNYIDPPWEGPTVKIKKFKHESNSFAASFTQGSYMEPGLNFQGVAAFQIPINHVHDDTEFLTSNNVRLAMDLNIKSLIWAKEPISGYILTQTLDYRYFPHGFKLFLRFRKYDGTYYTNSNWAYALTSQKMGLDYTGGGSGFSVNFNNLPDGDTTTGGFKKDTTTLSDNFDYWCTFQFSNFTTRNAHTVNSSRSLRKGDRAWIDNQGGLAYISEWTGSAWTDDVTGGAGIANGSIVVITGSFSLAVYKVQAGSPQTLVSATDGSDYSEIPVIKGRDLFDISELFTSTPIWSDIEAAEFIIGINQFDDSQFFDTVNNSQAVTIDLTFNKLPVLMLTKETETADRPLFTACNGKVVPAGSGVFPTPPNAIITYIMDKVYPNKYDSTSLSDLTNLASRQGWFWRKQFTRTETAESILSEILWNIWAVAVYDSDDNIIFKSLNPKDYGLGSPGIVFTDADIIEGSFSPVKMRKTSDIYQNFELGYNYQPPSAFSQAFEKYKNRKRITELTTNDGDAEARSLILRSKELYQTENTYINDFDYHYQDLPIAPWIVRWFVHNSWKVKFKVSISKMTAGNTLSHMDFVGLNSHFYTNDVQVEGFITHLEPELYNGVVSVEMYIYQPPGFLGVFDDPYNDALNLVSRNTTGWTNANGRLNDTGRLNTRTTTTEKDGGRLNTRLF